MLVYACIHKSSKKLIVMWKNLYSFEEYYKILSKKSEQIEYLF